MPLPKLFKKKGKLREPSSSRPVSSRHRMDDILSRGFIIDLKSRVESPTDLLDMVGYPRLPASASSPDLASPPDSSSSQQRRRQQRPSVGPRRASYYSFSPTTMKNPTSSRSAAVPASTTSLSQPLPQPQPQPQQQQQQQKQQQPQPQPQPQRLPSPPLTEHKQQRHQPKVGVTVYNDQATAALSSPSSPPPLIMPTPQMAVPLTKQMLLESNNPWADKTLDEDGLAAGYSRDEPSSRADAALESSALPLPPPLPAPPAPKPEHRHRQRSRSEINALYHKLWTYQQEYGAWAQRESEHRKREEWMYKKLQETRAQLKQLRLATYQQQQSQHRPIVDEAFCDEPEETSDVENEADRSRTNQNHPWRQYRVPENFYAAADDEDRSSYYSDDDQGSDNDESSGYVSEEEEQNANEREEMCQLQRRRYIPQRHYPHPAAAYYFYPPPHPQSDHVRPWSAVYHHQQQQQQQQQRMDNRMLPPPFYYYGYQQQRPLLRRRSRKSSDTSVRSVPVLRHSNSTTSSSRGGGTGGSIPRNSLLLSNNNIPPEFTGDHLYAWNPNTSARRTAYL